MGGVGKTQLALEYAYAHAGDFDLVWWLRAEEPATLLEDYAALAEPIGIAKAGEGDLAAVADAVRQALSRLDRWLLVFDNATGPRRRDGPPAEGRRRPGADHLAQPELAVRAAARRAGARAATPRSDFCSSRPVNTTATRQMRSPTSSAICRSRSRRRPPT